MNTIKHHPTLNIVSSYYFLILISMIYMSIMLCNAILTNRYIGKEIWFVLGGSFTSPLIFILDDIIAEIYGYKITQNMIFSGYLAQTVFVLICQLVMLSPHPSFFKQGPAYVHILGPSLLRIHLSGFISYMIANLVNSYILTRWKILLKGRRFWLRSLGASLFSEALYSFLAILMMELQSIPFHTIFKVIAMSYLIKAFYSATFAGPANVLVNYIKKKTGVDVYDFSPHFTPLKYLPIQKNKS